MLTDRREEEQTEGGFDRNEDTRESVVRPRFVFYRIRFSEDILSRLNICDAENKGGQKGTKHLLYVVDVALSIQD